MSSSDIIRIDSISQFFGMLGWEKPKHPLIGVIDITRINDVDEVDYKGVKLSSSLYSIFLKDGQCGIEYGRNKYDFEEGVLQFMGPNKVISTSSSHTPSSYGFMLLFHPDLIRNFDLGKRIEEYTFFDYGITEALHLSKEEEDILLEIAKNIKTELNRGIDRHSQEVIVTNLQLLLNYSKRFYERQFITRTNSSSEVVIKVEQLIKDYYKNDLQLKDGTPTPEYFAEKVNYSSHYLSDLLRKETGKTTKDHVDDYVVELAKNELSNSGHTVSEIAYDLGFNYPHYFSRMFKKRTGESPKEFRARILN